VYFFVGRSEGAPETFTQKMKRKIDSIKGRLIYNLNPAITCDFS